MDGRKASDEKKNSVNKSNRFAPYNVRKETNKNENEELVDQDSFADESNCFFAVDCDETVIFDYVDSPDIFSVNTKNVKRSQKKRGQMAIQNLEKELREDNSEAVCENKLPNTIAKVTNSLQPNQANYPEIKDNELNITEICDPFEKSLNVSFANLEGMHTKNLEKKVFNEESTVKDLSQFEKSSQYRHEVLDAFNTCEMTICKLNEDLFKENCKADECHSVSCQSILGNNSIWEKSMLEKSDIQNPFEFAKPTNLTQLLTGNIKNESEHNLSQIPIKKMRTPLLTEYISGQFYGLPLQVKSLINQYKGIEKLYDWQNECLTLPAILKRENLIYALPTSGGKTLVAEILMLREVIRRRKNVLFVLPFVSIVQEKVWGLSPFAVELDFLVEEYAGVKGIFPPRKRKNRKSIFIATIEKGLSLVRSLLENNRLHELGLIVVDELHLLGEPTRGCTLEMLLTNVMYSGEDIQIVGMSATIGNIDEIASFLDAEIFAKDFRPVELKEYIKLGNDVLRIDWNAKDVNERVVSDRKIDYSYSEQVKKIDPDHLGGLVMEVIPNGSCLIFCATKKNCENVAVLLCKVIFKKLLEYRSEEKALLAKALKAEGGGEDLLLSLFPWGVAYHHSGLSMEERRLIEDAFRAGVLNVLCCTSTLAAGVNLPAQRVILRAPLVGKDFISLATYKQMVGRAGRAGYGGHGESILICPSNLINKVKELLRQPMNKASSNLHCGTNMITFILNAIALKLASSRETLRSLMNSSLLFRQSERLEVDIKQLLDKTIETLFKMSAIRTKESLEKKSDIYNSLSTTQNTRRLLGKVYGENSSSSNQNTCITVTNNTELVVSRLGKAATKGSIELNRAHMLYADLLVAQRNFVLIDELHLLYLVTPYDLFHNAKSKLFNYHNILTSMDDVGAHTAKIIGFTESSAVQMALGRCPKNISERVLNRFYVTLMLYDLWKQKTLLFVCEKFEVDKGLVQNLMISVATFSSCVLRFCEDLEEFWCFKELLVTLNQRLSHFCTLELVPLMQLPYVKKTRAIQLYKAGFKTIQDVARAKPIDLMESLEYVNKNIANQLIAAAKLLLLEKVEDLREEAEEMIDGLNVK